MEGIKPLFEKAQHTTRTGWSTPWMGGDTWILPLPPPTNSLYPGIRRRHKSKAYKEWEHLAEAWWIYQVVQKRERDQFPRATYPKKDREKWALDILVFMPTWASGDLDGRFKALIDWLCKATGRNDRYLVRILSQRVTDGDRLSGVVVAFREV